MAQDTDPNKQPTWASPQTNDIVEEVRWWEAQNIPWQLVRELRRRSNNTNIGQNAGVNTVINFQTDHATYRGPMTAWVRAFSNGTGQIGSPTVPVSKYLFKNDQLPKYDGFLLQGGAGFGEAYGYKREGNTLVEDKAIIGYEATGKPHYIDTKYRTNTYYDSGPHCPSGQKFPQNSVVPSILPPPGIISVNVKTNKDMMSNATINWKCYSLAQLEYMMPFWLSPKINVFLEFGWNLFNIDSLLTLSDKLDCYKLIVRPEQALERYYKSFGNYGLVTGIISKYNFSTDDGFVYNCTTELISRQAMYAGFRADNPTVTDKEDGSSTEYVNLKEFFSTYLQFTKEVVEERDNFLNYILKNAKKISEKISKDAKEAKKTQSTTEVFLSKLSALGSSPSQPTPSTTPQSSNSQPSINSKLFYNGNPENRIFMGRYQSVYKGSKIPKAAAKKTISRAEAASRGGRRNPTPGNPSPPGSRAAAAAAAGQRGNQLSTNPSPPGSRAAAAAAAGQRGNPIPTPPKPADSPTISYGSLSEGPFQGRSIVSFADKSTDFDYEDGSNDEVWYQLDFVFELINLFCSEKSTKNNKIDISDIIITAHPNLISCDKHVLIPNPIAPKISIGRTPAVRDVAGNKKVSDGYLETIDASQNLFIDQFYWKKFDKEIQAGQLAEKNKANSKLDPECIDPNTPDSTIWKAALKARNTFKTLGSVRDNLDIVINWLYYNINNPNKSSAAFPFANSQNKYQPYYYGYLKHLYISKSKLIEIGKDNELKTLEQIVNKILSIINESVDNFWNLQTVKSDNGGLSIIDKNLKIPRQAAIYKFDIGSTSNVIKKIDFNVNMTNEQVNQVLYGSGQNAANVMSKITEVSKNMDISAKQKKDRITQIKTGLPSLVYADRFDDLELQKQIEQKLKDIDKEIAEEEKRTQENPNEPQNNGVPHGPIVDKNEEIRQLQTQGKQSDEILVMRMIALKPGQDPYAFVESTDKWFSSIRKGAQQKALVENTTSGDIKLGWVYLNLPSTLKGKLREMLDDGDTINNSGKYSGPADNFTLTLTFDGIFGFRMFQHIAIANLPKPYVPGNVIFMINEVDHQLNAGKWETVVTAMLRCAPDQDYKYILV